MRIMITGGAGFIGSHVVDLFIRKQHDVMILDDLSTGRMEWIKDAIAKHQKKVNLDLCRIQTWDHIEPIFRGFKPDVVCHLAAQPAISTSWTDPILNAQVNEIGTLNLLLAAKASNVKKFIFTSTCAVYKESLHIVYECAPKEPTSPYGISKLAAESYVRTMFPQSVILRLANVYGPRQVPIGENQVVPRMLRHFLYGDDFAIHGDGEQTRDFVFVEDVAGAFLEALYGNPGSYNIATGIRTSVNQLASIMEELYEVPGYNWIHTEEQDPRRAILLDTAAAYKDMGWKARWPLRDGLKATSDWWNKRKK